MAGKLAERLDMDAGTDLMNTLKNTAFKGGNVTDEQFTALLIVANQYGLNPWTREIYAFLDKGGIVPVVGVDGWSRIINEHPQFDGMEFTYDKDDARRPALIEHCEQAAAISMGVFAEAWLGLTQEERQIIGNAEKERIKRSIAVEAEFSEVPNATAE
ncbi:recombinase RecT [Enterobacteriaceae bacterium YMB-R22]|nr:recombinase RecT [Tenebrionicola larvae]